MHPTDVDTFYVGCDGGIWKSTDGGNNFTNLNGNLNVTQFYAIGVDYNDPETICGGSQDNSSLARTTNDLWDLQAVTGDGFVCHFNPQNPDYSYITSYPSGGYPNVWRSTTGPFGSFSDITGPGSGVISGDRSNWVTPYLIDPQNPSTLYLGTHRVYRSDDLGSSWVHVGPDDLTGGSGSLLSLEINRSFPSYVFSGSASGRVWYTSNGGADWTDITSGLPSRSINDIAADPTDPNHAFAVVGGFNTTHLWEWTGGVGWTERGTSLPNVPANTVLMLTATDLLVGTDTGVFRSYDGGQTFQPYMDGLPEGTVVTDLKYNLLQNIITAGTYGRGAWQVSIDPVHPIVVYDSVELPLVEVDGDGDANVEPGETWSVRPLLRNGGGETALGVRARLATATPGVTIVEPSLRGYGDIDPGAANGPASAFSFMVDPSLTCGIDIVFDIVDITSTNAPHDYTDLLAPFSVTVVDEFQPPVPTTHLDETFDPVTPGAWTHEAIQAGVLPCWNFNYFDEWNVTSKDAAHGDSYHCGNGPGGTYFKRNYAWLYYGGKDSTDGPGLVIPSDAIDATLTIVHWYDTPLGEDGGQVVVDSSMDDQDVYVTLEPLGGYPGGDLASGNCNGLQGQEAFQGSSGGWVTSSFDLMEFVGRRIYLAFVFGSDQLDSGGEGWYIDQVTVVTHTNGAAICDVTQWPGSVPATVHFELVGTDTIETTWDDSCNVASYPGQTYSIQAGDLDLLRSGGTYTHAPVAGLCNRTSPSTFTAGGGSEYYLVVPNADGREGGAGEGSGGPRPQASQVCGERREAGCP
jgi:hypothetical protein